MAFMLFAVVVQVEEVCAIQLRVKFQNSAGRGNTFSVRFNRRACFVLPLNLGKDSDLKTDRSEFLQA